MSEGKPEEAGVALREGCTVESAFRRVGRHKPDLATWYEIQSLLRMAHPQEQHWHQQELGLPSVIASGPSCSEWERGLKQSRITQ